MAQGSDGNEFDTDEQMINIRQFNSVNVFMNRVRSLDTVLENIESFSSKVSAERASQEELKASD